MSNPVVHAEITGTDADALRAFYGTLFGWSAPPGAPVASTVSAVGSYAFNAPDAAAGPVPIGIGGGPGFGARVTFYVGVDDIETSLARAVELGATEVVAPTRRPGGGLVVAQFADPQGNIIGLAAPA